MIENISYKDRDGFLYEQNGELFRFVAKTYAPHLEHAIKSGLIEKLASLKLIVPFTQLNENHLAKENWHTTLAPEKLHFVSYPTEWCFLQLKDAALHTLQILEIAIEHGMTLKDGTPYNIIFDNIHPKFADHLSFAIADFSKPWNGYKQFLEMFVFPLMLESFGIMETGKALTIYPNGVPKSFMRKVLPLSKKLNMFYLLNIKLGEKIERKNNDNGLSKNGFSKEKLINIVKLLQLKIQSLQPNKNKTTWGDYYKKTIIQGEYFDSKANIIKNLFEKLQPTSVLDIGTNDGAFAQIAAEYSKIVMATDYDTNAVNAMYSKAKKEQLKINVALLDIKEPLLPSGFFFQERSNFFERNKNFDVCMLLAIIHHLIIADNLSIDLIAKHLSKICRYAIVEFVPKDDEKVQILLKNRQDIFSDYSQENFESIITLYFTIEQYEKVKGSNRVMYLLKNSKP